MQTEQLRALVAIADDGTFEAAAARLHVTPSAVSQRIKALESEIGQVLLRRSVPARPTAAGQILLRAARQWQLLEAEALAEVHQHSHAVTELTLAVNADSLADWFVAVLHTVAGWGDTVLRLHVEDEDHSSALLRSGEVIGAVTADPVAVHGCSIEPLGAMRYLPVATPTLRDRYTTRRRLDWATMPALRFDAKDDISEQFLAERGVTVRPPEHLVPSSQGYLAAVRAGLGWGMVPQNHFGDDLHTGRLVLLAASGHVDVPLYWQAWRLRSPRIDRIGTAIRSAAAAGLRAPPRE